MQVILLVVAAAVLLCAWPLGASAADESRSRMVVLTDISNEPDDEESLVRFLVYANEFEVEGLVATTSTWLKDKTREDLIRRQLQAYAQVRPNLLKHAPNFPEAEKLLAVTCTGQPGYGMASVGAGKETTGSRRIIDAIDRADERPLWVSVWGGANTLAQALTDLRASRSADALKRAVAKLRVYMISDQDDAGAWIRKEFPDLFYIVSPSNTDSQEYWRATWTGISGDRWYKNGPGTSSSSWRTRGSTSTSSTTTARSARCTRTTSTSWRATRRRSWASSTTASAGPSAQAMADGAGATSCTRRTARRARSGRTTTRAATRSPPTMARRKPPTPPRSGAGASTT